MSLLRDLMVGGLIFAGLVLPLALWALEREPDPYSELDWSDSHEQ